MRQALRAPGPYLALALFWALSLALRPPIPPDETRYLTVAWEMYLRGDWAVPTLNGQPYHHKPPLLFWLIDSVWTLLGPSRWAAGLVVLATSCLSLFLATRVARSLFPDRRKVWERVAWVMAGTVPFVIYATLILFDLLLTCCVLASFLAMVRLGRTGRWRYGVLAGLAIGLGVLAKGPVVVIHVAWPIALYPLWRDAAMVPARRFLAGIALALPAALVPVAVWLVPALLGTDGAFARALLWDQSAGRISGNMEASHPRPFWFYLALLPVLVLPWLLSPPVWRAVPGFRARIAEAGRGLDRSRLRMLLAWALGIVAVFSLISGKQPHYVVPTIPLAAILVSYLLEAVPLRDIRRGSLVVLALFVLFQVGASRFLFPRFDLSAVAARLSSDPAVAVGFSGPYQGELNFLTRRTVPVQLVPLGTEMQWLNQHPDGFLVDVHPESLQPPGEVVLRQPYRDDMVSVMRKPGGSAP
ncbi:glycosyltransferase family 39 protein [Aureimonas sp. AU4]|uniref:ArnT family glycosyltransferase n=1 Tax=Aureimonas sp. AU4 TaxID=1638163 RepID=UPI0007806D9C|nr:glycosyltransferase family 39 protein [Aureimonas sp. AU4]